MHVLLEFLSGDPINTGADWDKGKLVSKWGYSNCKILVHTVTEIYSLKLTVENQSEIDKWIKTLFGPDITISISSLIRGNWTVEINFTWQQSSAKMTSDLR